MCSVVELVVSNGPVVGREWWAFRDGERSMKLDIKRNVVDERTKIRRASNIESALERRVAVSGPRKRKVVRASYVARVQRTVTERKRKKNDAMRRRALYRTGDAFRASTAQRLAICGACQRTVLTYIVLIYVSRIMMRCVFS